MSIKEELLRQRQARWSGLEGMVVKSIAMLATGAMSSPSKGIWSSHEGAWPLDFIRAG